MIRQFPYLVRLRGDRNQQLMISGLILTLICLALYINLAIMLSNRSSDQIPKPINNESNTTTYYVLNITFTNLPDILTSKKSITNSVHPVLFTTVSNQIEIYKNHSLTPPVEYETSGVLLDNSLYYNLLQFCLVDGYVSSVSLRLFHEWKGNASLYLFVILSNMMVYEIKDRYAINPQRNTTEWQTINIPSRVLPISLGNLFAIGMQDNCSSRNKMYAVKSLYGMRGTEINKDTIGFTPESDHRTGVAFSYTVIYNKSTFD